MDNITITINAKTSAYDKAIISCHEFKTRNVTSKTKMVIIISFNIEDNATNTMEVLKTVLAIESEMTDLGFAFTVEMIIDLKKFDVHFTTENNNHGYRLT